MRVVIIWVIVLASLGLRNPAKKDRRLEIFGYFLPVAL